MVNELMQCMRLRQRVLRNRLARSVPMGRSRSVGQLFGALLLVLLVSAVPVRAQQGNMRTYAIPSQSLGAALNQLALAADRQIMVPPDLVRGRTARALDGSYSLDGALLHLLAGSGLGYELSGPTVLIKRQPSVPAPSQSGTQKNRQSVEKPAVVEMTTVQVTGSRLSRASIEGPQEVKVYTTADIGQAGQKTVLGFLNTLSAVSTVVSEAGFDTVNGAGTVRLRGLPVGSTLVLLDGRVVEGAALSQSNGNPFDLNNIPVSAVERIEVVPEAASAVYGSDAIGGVVNIILRKDMDGGEVTVSSGMPTVGSYRDTTVGVAWGKSFDRGNVSLVGSYQTRGALLSTDRELTANQDFRRFGGSDGRSTSCSPGNVYSADGSNLPGLPSSFAGIPNSAGGTPTPADFLGNSGVLNKCSSGSFGGTVSPSSHRGSVLANGSFDFSGGVQGFFQAIYSQIKQDSWAAPRGVSRVSVPASNPYNPFGVPVRVTYRFASEGRYGPNHGVQRFSRVLGGLKGSLGERWDWEFAAWQSRDDAHLKDINTLDAAALGEALANTDKAQSINLFTSGRPASQVVMDRILYDAPQDGSSVLQTANGFVRGSLFDLPAGAVSVVLGGEYNRMRQSLFAPGQGLATTETYSRHYRSLYGEARVPLLASTDAGSAEKLALTAAARYDEYSDFGGQLTPQAGLEFRPAETLLLRASYGKAFKAPDLRAVYSGAVALNGIEVAPDPARGGEVYPLTLQFGGSPDLKPQTGTSRTLGLVWSSKAVSNLQVGLTNFRVTQDDRITQPNALTMIVNPEAFPGRVVRGTPTADDVAKGYLGQITLVNASYLNFGSLVVEGFDLDIDYRFDTPLGRFSPALSVTEIYKYDAAVAPGAPLEDRLGRASEDAFATRWKGTLALNYELGPWSARIAGRYVSQYLDYDFTRTLGDFWLFDASAHYDFGKGFAQADPFFRNAYADVSVVNALNARPQFTDYYGTGYDPRMADIRGRFITLTVGTRW